MRRFWSAAVVIGVLAATPVSAWDRGDVDVLTVLPDVTPGVPSSVEGLTVGPDDNIYVSTFGFNATGALSGNSVLYVIKPNGDLVRKVAIANSSPHTLGLAFNPTLGQGKFCMWIQQPALRQFLSLRCRVQVSMR
jgi:hypothetical protein